jgi:hypothetical protein
MYVPVRRNIVPYLKKYGTSPVTGEKMKYKDLIKLNIFKNASGMHLIASVVLTCHPPHVVTRPDMMASACRRVPRPRHVQAPHR